MSTRLLLVVSLVLTGCGPDFIQAWEVAKPRLMTAKVVIDGDDQGRSRPRPGETFSIEMYLMSAKEPQTSYTGELATCIGAVLPDGQLVCAAEQTFADVKLEPYAGDDRLVFSGFTVPDIFSQPDLPPPLDTLERVSLFGALCVDGRIERVPDTDVTTDPISTLYRCVDNDDSEHKTQMPFTMSVWLDRGTSEFVNHNPTFACDAGDEGGACRDGVERDGEQVPGSIVMRLPKKVAGEGERSFEWQAWDATQPLPWDDCASAPDSLPRVHVGDGAYDFYFRFDPGDRETYERTIEVNGKPQQEERREELVVSHALTTKGGDLDGYTSVVRLEKEDAEADSTVKYTPPPKPGKKKKVKDPVPPEGRLVRFFFSVRDQRGGVDFTTRELCLLPYVEEAADD